MFGKRSTLRRVTASAPSAITISDSIRMRIGFRSASRVSHMVWSLLGYWVASNT